nr:MAG TPA: hypothetical protein [Caudoviricetes sp.]
MTKVMTFGLVIPSQCAHWRGNLCSGGNGLPRRPCGLLAMTGTI